MATVTCKTIVGGVASKRHCNVKTAHKKIHFRVGVWRFCTTEVQFWRVRWVLQKLLFLKLNFLLFRVRFLLTSIFKKLWKKFFELIFVKYHLCTVCFQCWDRGFFFTCRGKCVSAKPMKLLESIFLLWRKKCCWFIGTEIFLRNSHQNVFFCPALPWLLKQICACFVTLCTILLC